MPRFVPIPSYENILAAPELGVLTLLEASADLASLALAAAYPEIQVLSGCDEPPELREALAIMNAASTLVAAINHYRLALVLAKDRVQSLPF
jgi:hypothetical protein